MNTPSVAEIEAAYAAVVDEDHDDLFRAVVDHLGSAPDDDPFVRFHVERLWAQREDERRAADAAAGSAVDASAKVDEIRRALLDEAQDTRDGNGPAREELPGTNGLLYRGQAHLFFGERGGGKTLAVKIAALSAAAHGERVLYLDRENGQPLTRDRIECVLDANPEWGDLLDDGSFTGRHYPELRADWPTDAYAEAIAGAGFTLVAFDSFREFLTGLGLEPNSDADVSGFITRYVTPLLRRGVAVALCDNVGHQDKDRPKNSGTKLDAIPQGYKVVAKNKFSVAEQGLVVLGCTRSRFGDMGREWHMTIGAGTYQVPRARDDASVDQTRRLEVEGKRLAFITKCVLALRDEQPVDSERELIKRAREHGAKGRDTTLRAWLAQAVADPTSGIEHGAAGYVLHGFGGASQSAGRTLASGDTGRSGTHTP